MINRARRQHRFGAPEDLLHHPQLFVRERNLARRHGHRCREDPLTVIPYFLLDFFFIDDKSTAGALHIFTIPFVANQALASLLQFLPKRCNDGSSIGGVFLPLVLIDTHDIAAFSYHDVLHFERGWGFTLLAFRIDLFVVPSAAQYLFAHFLLPPHPRSQNVIDLPLLQVG